MSHVKLSEIIVPEARIRKIFVERDIEELAASMVRLGLMHAPVFQNDGITLIAGERRIRAITLIYERGDTFNYHGKPVPKGYVPVVTLSDLSVPDIKEAELEENIRRVNITWREKAEGVTGLHELRKAQAEAAGEVYRPIDTAREISGEEFPTTKITDVKNDLLVSAYADDPEVAAAKTREEAVKVIEKKLQKEHRAALARDFQIDKLKTPHRLIQGDMEDIFPKFEHGEFDLIIADPPYGIAADKFANQNAVRHTYSDDVDYSTSIYNLIAKEGFRTTKEKAHAYIFCDIMRFPDLTKIFREAGWYVWRTPLVWFRGPVMGLLPRPEHGPRRVYEAILYAIKGDRRVTGVYPDVVYVDADRSVERAAHKPIELYENLMRRSAFPGDTVLDPCCGTGPVFPAATSCDMVATGVEVEAAAFGQAVQRVTGEEEVEDG